MKTKLAFVSQEGKTAVLKFYDSLLEQWVLPYEKLNVKTRYGDTFMIACGAKNAPPLILLHGGGMNSLMWLGDAREYSRNYRVYAVDIPGEPGRSDENRLPLNSPSYADWLHDVFNTLSIEKANLIGISLGAWLSIKFAAGYPEKVNKLVLLSPLGIVPQRKSFLLIAVSWMILGERGIDKLSEKVHGSQSRPEVMQRFQKLIGKNCNSRNELIPLFSDNELKRLTMPVILFVGQKDIIIHAVKTAKHLGESLPNANINMLPEAGHALIYLADKISLFLQSRL